MIKLDCAKREVICIDICDPSDCYYDGFVAGIINEMFPIIMPEEPIKVYCKRLLFSKENVDYDITAIYNVIKSDNGEIKNININRFFKKIENDGIFYMIEISEEIYKKYLLASCTNKCIK